MAEAIGLLSGGITLVDVAAKSGLSLVKLLESFHNHNKTVGELQQELVSLNGLLRELGEVVMDSPVDVATLDLPLRQCAQICRDFEALITKCTAHFDESKTSFRDWARTKIKEDEIISLKSLIASYKSTIIIALGCINLRTVKMTTDGIHKWQRMIANTTSGLEEQLGRTDHRLETLAQYGAFVSHADVAERDRLQTEKSVIKQCLIVCARGAIETKQLLNSVLNVKKEAINEVIGEGPPEWRMLANIIQENEGRYGDLLPALETRLQGIDEKLEAIHSSIKSKLSQQIQNEKNALECCVTVCAEACRQANEKQRNLFEDLTASNDAFQVIVSTPQELVSARRVSAGPRAVQCLGPISEPALLQISKDRIAMSRLSSAQSTSTEKVQTKGKPAFRPAEPVPAAGEPTKKSSSRKRQPTSWTRILCTLATTFQR